MKFSFQNVGRTAGRLGHITDIGRHGEKVLSTPACFVYTRNGSVPHLTHEVLQMVTTDTLPMMFPLPNIHESYEVVNRFTHGLGTFTGLNDHILYSSVQDSSNTYRSGYNDKFGISLWSKCGRKHIDVEHFMKIQNAFLPDIYQALCDSDTLKETSKKRITKSVERSLDYLDKCLEIHQKSDRLVNTAVFGTIEGGFDVELRKRSAKQTAERPVAGFVIDGLNNYGPDTECLHFEEIRNILEETLSVLPADKPRIMHLVWHPRNVISAVELGIDVFDASYPFIVCERGCASVFEYRKGEIFKMNENLLDSKVVWELNLKDERYKDDLLPLVDHCTCYTCRRFTRAYINHLLNTSEMLAFVLLMIHNLHHYLKFFEVLREALQDDWIHVLKANFQD